MKIGVMVESFAVPFRQGVEKASKLGLSGIQAYATGGELAFEGMTPDKIRETLDIVKSHGLVFSAICGDFGHGFADEAKNPELVEKSKRVVDLALKLETGIVTTHIGEVPAQECHTRDVMRKACRELAVYADSVGAAFAVETGPETGAVLYEFLDSLGAMGVRVNLDPANLIMCVNDDPVKAVHTLKKYIVHTHAKDGVQRRADPLECEELPLGQGGVKWDAYLKALKGIGFDGFLTIERECGSNPEADIVMAAQFLREQLKQ